MTSAAILSETDWDTVHALFKDAAVAQYGYGDGTDCAALVESATMLFAMVPGVIEDGLSRDASYMRWRETIERLDVHNQVFGSLAPFPDCSQVFPPGMFGFAFVYPPALGKLRLLDVLLEAQRVAQVVAVVVDRIPYRIADIMNAAARPGWVRYNSGQLAVLKRTAQLPAAYPAVM